MSQTTPHPRYATAVWRQTMLPPTEKRLSIIEEDADILSSVPTIPSAAAQSSSRPSSRRLTIDHSSTHSFDTVPSVYSSVWNVTGPKGENFEDVRNNRPMARRGRWRTICLTSVVLVLVVVAVIVAVIAKLHSGAGNSSSSSSPPSNLSNSSASSPGPFPCGTYSIAANLYQNNSDCTSNPATWRCYPYATYHDSAQASLATFNWIISPSAHPTMGSNLSISSTDNPFAINFANVSLALVDAGLDTEHYSFAVVVPKIVDPKVPITDDNSFATCFFNHTTLQASLYTRKPSTVNAASSTASSLSGSARRDLGTVASFQAWPYAVEIAQMAGGGPNVPNCYHSTNGVIGAPITNGLAAKQASDSCSCQYKNFGL